MDINNVKSKSKSIVLNAFNIKENTRILKVFSYEYGRLDLIIQGIKLKNDKISLDVFTEIIATMSIYSNYSYLLDYELVKSNYKIRSNNKNIIYANLVLEIIQVVFPLYYSDRKIYGLTEKYLQEISKPKANQYLQTIAYIIKFLAFMGYKPEVSKCITCGDEQSEEYFYSVEDMAIVCKKHITESYMNKLFREQISLLNKLLYSKFEEIQEIEYEDNYYLLMLLLKSLESAFGINKLNSHKFLENIKRGIYG